MGISSSSDSLVETDAPRRLVHMITMLPEYSLSPTGTSPILFLP